MSIEDLALARQAVEYLEHPLSRFLPWRTPEGRAPQQDFLRAAATHKRRVFRAGNQVGKTTGVAVDVALRLKGWHPFARRPAPVKGWWSCLDWEFGVGQIAWPALKRWLAPGDVAGVAYMRRQPVEIPTSVHFTNGSVLEFKSAEAGRTKYQSASLDFVAVDEEHPPDIIEEILLRLVARDGDFFASLTPLQRERWVVEMERDQRTHVTRASMLEAARAGILPLAEVQALADSLPERQRRVRIYGDHATSEGLVYPEFSRTTHVLVPRGGHLVGADGQPRFTWPLPDSWERFASMDFGYSVPASIVQVAVDPASGTTVVERNPYAAFVRASRWAELIPELIPYDRLANALVCDHDAMERAELAAKGIGSVPATKDVVPGIECVERYLTLEGRERPQLYVVMHEAEPPRHDVVGRVDGYHLVRELEAYAYPKQEGDGAAKKDLPVKKDDHACDALRYLLMQLERRFGRSMRIAVADEVLARSEASPISRTRIWD